MEMVYVPGGEFVMGSSDEKVDQALALCGEHLGDCQRSWFENEQPVHTVTLAGFWLDQTEVSNAQYRQCVEGGDCQPPDAPGSSTRDLYYDDEQYDDYPVIWVSWPQAAEYCAWAGGRLPTEAEWEYAARDREGRVFPWGDAFDIQPLNYCDANCALDWADEQVDDGHEDTAPVGSYADGVSWCGALDMAGNVWEWVADWYSAEYYSQSPEENPTGPETGDSRVLRGGSWHDNPAYVRGANRFQRQPGEASDQVGFRCVRSSK
jgi:formylglycine-generating enzyme required for sulfatase activity